MLPNIPEDIITNQDTHGLSSFMLEHYNSRVDKRKSFGKALTEAKKSIIRKRRYNEEQEKKMTTAERHRKHREKHRNMCPDRRKHLFEDDTSAWFWDKDRVEWLEPGKNEGSCRIKILQNNRVIAVTRDTAPMFFRKFED